MTFTLPPIPIEEMSMAERLTRVPEAKRNELQASLSQSQREALKWNWEFLARPDQMVPDDCSIYVRSAGRGSGKTREGSEWARKKGPKHREGLLIGANPRDARDLMIEGRSGIRSITPPWERPVYEPTKLLLRWPNGAIAHVRSAEDPASIRGLSVDWCWCFPAGTMVTTVAGQVPIEQVAAGDSVLTRQGFKMVLKSLSRRTTAMAVLRHSEGVLRATPEHPIWTERGWIPMQELVPGDTIATWQGSSKPLAWSAAPRSLVGPPITILPKLAPALVESVSVISADEQVYDLKVEGAHEFIADGVLAHNCDEIVKWRFLQQTWDQSRLALREGIKPQTVVTTTPMPLPLIKKLLKGGRGMVVRPPVSTYRNRYNLSPDWFQELLDSYEGTRLGDQELHAMVLEDVRGAMWTHEMIEKSRWDGEFIEAPSGLHVPALAIRRRVVGVDPSGSATGDECGIVVMGTDGKRPATGFVFDDYSIRGTSEIWGHQAVKAYWEHGCEALVCEVNYGGEMVERVIRTIPAKEGIPSGENVRIEVVRAGRGQSKYQRAVPIAGLFEQNLRGHRRIFMVGVFKELEGQMTTWIPKEQADGIEVFESSWSPDRVDAMVWAALYLLVLNPRVQGRAETDLLCSTTI